MIHAPATRTWYWLAALVLLSGAGLIALVVLNLWQAVRDADDRAALGARVDAETMARDLEAVLRTRDLLEVLPERVRFEVRDGALQVPPDVAWLDSPPDLDPYDDLDLIVQDKLDRARQIDFEAGDPSTAAGLFDQVLEDAVLSAEAEHWVLAMAAWQAHRAGEMDRRDGLLRRLDEAEGGGLASIVSSSLLHASFGRPLPAWSARMRLLPPAAAHPVFARLGERDVDTSALEADLAATAARRETLLAVQVELDNLIIARLPIARPLGERLLVFFPEARGGSGALLHAKELTTVLRTRHQAETSDSLPTIRWAGELVYRDLPADAFIVVPGLLGVMPTILDGSLLSQPWFLGVAMAVLAAVFGLGLFFSFRSLRREAEAIRARAQFLTTVTHELKTPLAGIRLLSEMLEEGRVQAEGKQREYFSLLSGEAARLTMLIENVLDLGRMERGERSYDMQPHRIDEIVNEAAELFGPVAERDGMALALDLEKQSSATQLDRGAFVQALLNVMDNARKYAARGGRLDVRGVNRNGSYEVSIRDHGPGISEEEVGDIFERFHRGVSHRDGSIPGVGLGLYLARTILHRHGGELEVESPSGGGACFRFTLPLGDRS